MHTCKYACVLYCECGYLDAVARVQGQRATMCVGPHWLIKNHSTYIILIRISSDLEFNDSDSFSCLLVLVSILILKNSLFLWLVFVTFLLKHQADYTFMCATEYHYHGRAVWYKIF